MEETIIPLLEKAIKAREALFEAGHKNAFRLFNGFLEGFPELVVDVYGTTVVFFNYAEAPEEGMALGGTGTGIPSGPPALAEGGDR